MFSKKIVDRGPISHQAKHSGQTGGKFVDPAGELEEHQQNPVPQRRFIVVIFPVQGGRDVVAGKLHLQSHQSADCFIIDESQFAQVDQQGRRQ